MHDTLSRRILADLHILELCEVAVDAMPHKDKIVGCSLRIWAGKATVYGIGYENCAISRSKRECLPQDSLNNCGQDILRYYLTVAKLRHTIRHDLIKR